MPAAACAARSASPMSPTMSSIRSADVRSPSPGPRIDSARASTSANRATWARSSRLPTERLSTMRMTSLERAASARTRFRPINPQPPVMSQRTALSPPHPRKDAVDDDAVLRLQHLLQHAGNHLVGHEMRLEPEIGKAVMGGVVIVLLHLLARIVDILHLDVQAKLGADPLHPFRQLIDREGLGELVEDPKLTG